jgi:hypothetical protein
MPIHGYFTKRDHRKLRVTRAAKCESPRHTKRTESHFRTLCRTFHPFSRHFTSVGQMIGLRRLSTGSPPSPRPANWLRSALSLTVCPHRDILLLGYSLQTR